MTDMRAVRAHTTAPGVDPDRLWSLLTAGTELPAVCDQVLAVAPGPDGRQHWRVLLNGSEVEWEQTTRPRGPDRLDFEQVTGDLAELRGAWSLDGGRLDLALEFHLGVDGLAPLLDPMWTQSLRAFADSLVRGVAGAAAHDPEAQTP